MDFRTEERLETINNTIFINFELLFESKFVYYSIIRYLNEKLIFKDDLCLSWLQKLDFNNIEQFVSYFNLMDKEELKNLIKQKITESELIKTIKPKLFFLHKLANLITFIKNFSDHIHQEYSKALDNNSVKNIFNLNILYNNDFLENEFIRGTGKSILEEIKNILIIYVQKNSIDNKEGKYFSINIEFAKRSDDNYKDILLIKNKEKKNLIIIIDFEYENFLNQIDEEILETIHFNNFANVLYLYKSLPKSEKVLDKEKIKQVIENQLEKYSKQNENLAFLMDNLMSLFIIDENAFFQQLLVNLINLETNISSKNSKPYKIPEEQNLSIYEEFNIKNFFENFRKIYFQNKPLEQINEESNINGELISRSEKISTSKLFEILKPNYFVDAFLNLNNFSEFIFKFQNSYLAYEFSYLKTWKKKTELRDPIYIEGTVTHGLKRGSKLLGIPTANLTPFNPDLIKDLLNGVYYGEFIFLENKNENPAVSLNKKYKVVLSIGYNPQFDNREKSIEVYLIDFEGEDFYDYKVSLNILGYMRTEAAFENFQELVTSISYDIIVANSLL